MKIEEAMGLQKYGKNRHWKKIDLINKKLLICWNIKEPFAGLILNRYY